jgi:hypothetical protein
MAPCQCTTEGYHPECPNAFTQGGQRLHTIDDEIRLKPRIFKNPQGMIAEGPDDYSSRADTAAQEQILSGGAMHHGSTNPHSGPSNPMQFLTHEAEVTAGEIEDIPAPLRTTQVAMRYQADANTRVNTDELTEKSRGLMRAYEPLTIGQSTLTEYSIGGFQLDPELAASKFRQIQPLPPAKLPIIFNDNELNFFHHFFGGLRVMMGLPDLTIVTKERTHHEHCYEIVKPFIMGSITAGYSSDDTDLEVFIKKVLMSTFDETHTSTADMGICKFHVSSNIWGFQYIEQGMTLGEADLRMWLSMNYSRYQSVWFNVFKGSGVPSFAKNGVRQDESGTMGCQNARNVGHQPIDIGHEKYDRQIRRSQTEPQSRSMRSGGHGARESAVPAERKYRKKNLLGW